VLTIWSRFGQYRALTHGFQVIRGRYDEPDDPGAINHFQALSAALSATVGLGNIGGVALAISLGGPGAVFWMWVVGFFGMAIKLTEVTCRCSTATRRPGQPARRADVGRQQGPGAHQSAPGGRRLGAARRPVLRDAADLHRHRRQHVPGLERRRDHAQLLRRPGIASGILMALIVGVVIIGGIKRIGAVAGPPGAVHGRAVHARRQLRADPARGRLPGMLGLIVRSAFGPTEAAGRLHRRHLGYAFLYGMKRALFSNEAGQGSSPIAHSAAKTREPVREGVVAGLEPFIDTIVVCTFTALVILSTGVWNRGPDTEYGVPPAIEAVAPGVWTLESGPAPDAARRHCAMVRRRVRVHDRACAPQPADRHRPAQDPRHRQRHRQGRPMIEWRKFRQRGRAAARSSGLYVDYQGATLTARAFDSVTPGLGKWLVTLAAWLFALSTMISWSYYGEQGMIYLAGERSVLPYKFVFCLLIIVATIGLVQTDRELDNLTGIGTGVMLFANLPIIWLFSRQAMAAYRDYISGSMPARSAPGTSRRRSRTWSAAATWSRAASASARRAARSSARRARG
jgi:alanine or glycine:cation symporter, AGCS family